MTNKTYCRKLWQQLMAHFNANVYVLFHWDCRTHYELEWIRRPGHQYSEHTYFIGGVNDQQELVRSYYGVSRFRLHAVPKIKRRKSC